MNVMITFLRLCVLVMLSFSISGLTSCERKTDSAPGPTESGTGSQEGVFFGEGFYKEEATGGVILRWVRQNASLRLTAPADGRYRLAFRPITVFTPTETAVEVSVNGTVVGNIATRSSDLANPPSVDLEAPLRAGENEIRLKSIQGELKLPPPDGRTPAFGLVLPIGIEKLP